MQNVGSGKHWRIPLKTTLAKNFGDLALETLLAKKPWRMSSYRHTFMMHRFSITPYTYKRWRLVIMSIVNLPCRCPIRMVLLVIRLRQLNWRMLKSKRFHTLARSDILAHARASYSIYLPLIIRNPTLIRIMHVIELYGR